MLQPSGLPTRDLDFATRREADQESTVRPRSDVFDIPQINDAMPVGAQKYRRVEALFEVAKAPIHHGVVCSEVQATVIAFGLDQADVAQLEHPASLTIFYKNRVIIVERGVLASD